MEIESRLRDAEIRKNFPENRLNEQLRAISEQRMEIDRKKQVAIATMLKDDQEHKIRIGSFLKASGKEAFKKDDIRHTESTAMDRLETDSDENDDNVP